MNGSQIEHAMAVPPVVSMMMKNSQAQKYQLSHLRDMVIGGAPLKPDVEYLLLKQYPGIQLRQGNGSRATTSIISITHFIYSCLCVLASISSMTNLSCFLPSWAGSQE